MRIPHPVPISFPPCDAHEKISSTCAKIPTILASTSQMRSLDTRNGEFSSQENTAGTSLALSQIRRFTVEYPSSTSFFKLSTDVVKAGIRGEGLCARCQDGNVVKAGAAGEDLCVKCKDGNVVKAGVGGEGLCARYQDGNVVKAGVAGESLCAKGQDGNVVKAGVGGEGLCAKCQEIGRAHV